MALRGFNRKEIQRLGHVAASEGRAIARLSPRIKGARKLKDSRRKVITDQQARALVNDERLNAFTVGESDDKELARTAISLMRINKIPEPQGEFMFSLAGDWLFDFAWPEIMLAVEVHGATWVKGRHTRGKGFENDRRKINTATMEGWRVLEFTREMVENDEMVQCIKDAYEIE